MNLGMQVNKIKILRMEHKKGGGAMLLSPKINSTGLPDSPAASSVAPVLHEILIPVKGGRRPLDKKKGAQDLEHLFF